MVTGTFLDGSPIYSEISSQRWLVVGSDLSDSEFRDGWNTGNQSPSLYLKGSDGSLERFSFETGAFQGWGDLPIPHEWICNPDIIGQWVRVTPDYDDLKIVWESDLKKYA